MFTDDLLACWTMGSSVDRLGGGDARWPRRHDALWRVGGCGTTVTPLQFNLNNS